MPLRTPLLMFCLIAAMPAIEVPPIASILVLGDSISRHGPSEALGWTGDWGMAASAREKDWPHLLQARIAEHQHGKSPELIVQAAGGGRLRDHLARIDAITAQHAPLIVVQMGENENTPELVAGFEQDYDALVTALRTANPTSRIVCCGVWGGSASKDAIIRRVCAKHDAWFAGIIEAWADPANRAKADGRWTHAGVNWHPGDRGMQAYANAIWRVLSEGPAPGSTAVAPTPGTTVLAEDFTDAAAQASRWHGSGEIADGSWRIALTAPGSAILTTALPLPAVAGHRVRITARVRADEVTSPPKPWNGIKVQLAITDAEAHKDWPQAQVAVGTFAWTTVQTVAFIPGNAVDVHFNLGLEAVAGTVWFDDVRIETLPE